MWIERDHEPNGHGGLRRTVDEPSPAVLADGMFGVGRHQVFIVTGPAPAPPPDPTKPAYRVPLMAEVDALRGTNGLTVVSTFSGCGGSCLGFEMAGYRVLYALEFVEAARETYRLNHPGVIVDDRDVRIVKPEEILAMTGMDVGEVDVLEGSPPCASFSTAGKREAGWGRESKYSETKQRTDDLFFEYARLVEGIQPRVFVAENVSGLVKGAARGYFKEIHERLSEAGYRVEARLLDAQWLGTPQARQRVIFVGVRNDLTAAPAFPRPLPFRYSVREALPWLKGDQDGARVIHDTSGQYGAGDVTNRPAPAITVGVHSVNSMHYQVHDDPAAHLSLEASGRIYQAFLIGPMGPARLDPDTGDWLDPETGYRISLGNTAIGPEWDRLAPGETSDRYFNLVRPLESEPAPTVTQAAGGRGTAGITHPSQRRKFTLVELRRLCGFPDDFALTGSYQQRWERLGRAVPPTMMFHVARVIRDEILAAGGPDPLPVP